MTNDTIAMNKQPRIAAIGIASMETVIQVEAYPPEGGHTVVKQIERQPGGSTVYSSVAAARLGADVSLASCVGQDQQGDELLAALLAEAIDTSNVHRAPDRATDATVVLLSRATGKRTIFQKQGARPSQGATLDIDALFSADVCLVDVDDLSLYRFLADLPVHTQPTARLLGTITYLAERPGPATAEILQRLDVVAGSARDAMRLTGTSTLEAALRALQLMMRGSSLRFAAITTSLDGACCVSPDQLWQVDAHREETVDATGAGDAFTGALAYAIALRWNPADILRFCSIVAGLSNRCLGARAGFPAMDGVREILENRPPAVAELTSTIEG